MTDLKNDWERAIYHEPLDFWVFYGPGKKACASGVEVRQATEKASIDEARKALFKLLDELTVENKEGK